MSDLNIFCIIRRVSSRIEPYCSQFFADALSSSIKRDKTLFEKVWTLCAPPDWNPRTNAHIFAEDILGEGRRIDITIVDESSARVLGIEVKTTDRSVKPGQLETYYGLLNNKYPSKQVSIAFLTPFNEGSVKEIGRDSNEASRLPSVDEYREQCRFIPPHRAVHVSWQQIANINWAEEPLWGQFAKFVQDKIAPPHILETYLRNDQSLTRFFSDEAINEFGKAMQEITFSANSVDFDTLSGDPNALQSLLDALTALIEDDQSVNCQKFQRDKFSEDRINELVNSEYGRVHKDIFKLSIKYRHVWIEGEKDYGLRVAHNNHKRNGVSILTSNTKDRRFKIKSI